MRSNMLAMESSRKQQQKAVGQEEDCSPGTPGSTTSPALACVREPVEQRGLAGVGVAHQRHDRDGGGGAPLTVCPAVRPHLRPGSGGMGWDGMGWRVWKRGPVATARYSYPGLHAMYQKS